MTEIQEAFCFGFSTGACVMWAWFLFNPLIRNEEEWKKATGRK